MFVLAPFILPFVLLIILLTPWMVGGMWDIFNRIAFVMERKMMLTIR
jgi:hypothetical protein